MEQKLSATIIIEQQLWVECLPELFEFFAKTLLVSEKNSLASGPRDFCYLFTDSNKESKADLYDKEDFRELATSKYLFAPEQVKKMDNLHKTMILKMINIINGTTFFELDTGH